jgi:hypothetical protein
MLRIYKRKNKNTQMPKIVKVKKEYSLFETANAVKQQKPNLQYMPIDSASQVARLVEKDCRIIGLTRGQFSLIDLIYSILQHVGKSKVTCATWSAGIKDANTVKWMVDSDLIESFMLVTDHSYVTRQPKYALQLTELFGKDNIRTSELHAKFVLIENESFKITIRTSMNLNANRTCENFEIDESESIFKFYKDFVLGTFGEMPVGFTANSKVVNSAIDRIFNNLDNEFKWMSNE